MYTPTISRYLKRQCAALMLLSFATLGVFAPSAYAQQPSQEPLLARTQSVRPNLSIMFDDSLSMLFNCNYTANVSAQALSTYGGIGTSVGCRNVGNFTNGNRAQMSPGNPIYASPVNNELAYDPRQLYVPPFISPTTRAGAANVAINFPLAANVTRFNPNGNSNGVVQASSTNNTPTAFVGPAELLNPLTVDTVTGTFRLVHLPINTFNPATANLAGLENLANYSSIAVSTAGFMVRAPGQALYSNNGATNPLPKPPGRTDCTLNTQFCTAAEETRNIANWHLYYKNRLKAFRVGVAEAFTGLPDTFRFNYTSLGRSLYDFSSGSRVVRAANDFAGIPNLQNYSAGLANFYTWLFADTGVGFNTVAQSGTPLRQAYDRLGQYYLNNTSNNGPWGSTPGISNNETAAQHLSCRKSFAILATDGFWNNGAGTLPALALNGADTDGTNGPTLVNNSGNVTYQYRPGTANPFALGKRDSITSNAGTAATLADVAMYYWVNDLRSGNNALLNNVSNGTFARGPFWQHLNLTTVAFGANGSLPEAQIAQARAGQRAWPAAVAESATALDDLAHAAHNTGGDFLSVSNAAVFASRLRDRLLSISGEESSQAGVAGSSQVLTAGTLKVEASFTSGNWWGNLNAIELNALNGSELATRWSVVELGADGSPNGTTTIPTPTTREIYTYVDASTAPIEFRHFGLQANSLIGSGTGQLTSTWSAGQTDFIRGVRTQEGDERPFRQRASIMGDIVNSTPVFVKNSIPNTYRDWSSAAQQVAYRTYRTTKANRTNGLVMVGANDGMLHAFREQDGREIFAYIPRAVLSRLHHLTEKNYSVNHRFYVDGPLNEADAYITTPNASGVRSQRWSNLVLGTTGAGAKSVFAIDTTELANLRNDDILWEINELQSDFQNDLGYITQRVQAGVTVSGDWVAIFGNGVGSTSGLGKLFIVNLATGALLQTINTDTLTGNGVGGVRLVRNEKGEILGAYAGDFRGRMWRFDLSATQRSSWPNTAELLFTAPATTAAGTTTLATPAITASPVIVGRTDGRPGYIVTFGTGRLLYNADTTTPHPLQRAYGIWDTAPFGGTQTFRTAIYANLVVSTLSVNNSTANSTISSFYNVAASRTFDWSTDHGWRLDLNIEDGQRIIYPAEPINGLVQLQTAAPRALSANACTNDGAARGYNLFIDPLRGGCRSGTTLDTNRDNLVTTVGSPTTPADSTACGVSTLADGANKTLCSNGNCDEGGDGPQDPDIVCTVDCVPPPCKNPRYYSVDTAAGAQLLQTCDPIASPDPLFKGFTRTTRQVFIRK